MTVALQKTSAQVAGYKFVARILVGGRVLRADSVTDLQEGPFQISWNFVPLRPGSKQTMKMGPQSLET